MSKRNWSLSLILLGGLAVQVGGGTSQVTRVDEFEVAARAALAEFIRSTPAEAVSVSISVGTDTLFEGGVGPIAPDDRGQSTEDTPFNAAGMVHGLLVTAALQLEAAEKLSHEDRIAAHLPDLLPKDCPVRVGELMSHTSGLPDFRDFAPGEMLVKGRPTYEAVFASIVEIPPVTGPGECVQVNPTDTLLLAALIEKVAGKPADELLQTMIFNKLEMDDTSYDLNSAVAEASAKDGDEGALAFMPRGLTSSAADLMRFQRGLIDLTLLDSDALGSMNAIVRLADGSNSNCGLGVSHVQLHEATGRVLGEATDKGAAQVAYYAEYDLSVAVMARGESLPIEGLARDLARLVIEEPEVGTLDLPLNEDGLRPYLGNYQIGCSTVVIRAEGARIVMDEIDAKPEVFLYQGDHVFIAKEDSDVHITFEVVDELAVSFTLERHGVRSKAVRFQRDR